MSELNLSEEYWNQRYVNQEIGWDLGGASPPIVKWLNRQANTNLKILIPGAGLGHDVIYAYNQGFKNVYYMDYAQDAINTFKKNCPSFPEDQILKGDFFKLSMNNHFDVIIEQTFFCAQNPNKRKDYVNKMSQLLSHKGQLVGLLFNTEFDKPGPPFGGNTENYKLLFSDHFEIVEFNESSYSVNPRKGIEIWINLKKIDSNKSS